MAETLVRQNGFYNWVCRWHSYAGVICIPFMIWLAVNGSIYLWRPQIEAWLDRPYEHLAVNGRTASPDAQVAAALKAVPGSSLSKYELPQAADSAIQILVERNHAITRVYVHPVSTEVLNVAAEEKRPMRLVSHLHGELLVGTVGSYLVEIAACWAIVMLIIGLYFWWPRGGSGLAGIAYPCLRGASRIFWRDIHATTGVWVSGFALVLILTGLPWANAWVGYLGEVRLLTGTARGPVDWTIGGKKPLADDDPAGGEHAQHMGMHMGMLMAMPMSMPASTLRQGELLRVIAAATPVGIAPPVQISPPKRPGAPWLVTSDAANRSLRGEIRVDGASGRAVSRTDFADRHVIDRIVGYGIAVREGALFGLINQIVGTLTALFLVVLAVSGAIMWRRPVGLLGAPVPLSRPRFGFDLIAVIVALGLYLSMFRATLLAMLAVKRFRLANLPAACRWLGLRTPVTPERMPI